MYFSGGKCIQDDSDELIAEQGKLSEGEVAVTKAGSLACSWVLHAVGPTWKGGSKGNVSSALDCLKRLYSCVCVFRCVCVLGGLCRGCSAYFKFLRLTPEGRLGDF